MRVVAVRRDPVVRADDVEAVALAAPLGRLPTAAPARPPAAGTEPAGLAGLAGLARAEPAGDGAMPHRLQ